MQTNPAVEQNKTLNGPLVREISPVGKEKVYGGNDLVKSQVGRYTKMLLIIFRTGSIITINHRPIFLICRKYTLMLSINTSMFRPIT